MMKINKLSLQWGAVTALLMLPMVSAFADTTQTDVSQLPAMLSQNFHLVANIMQAFSIAGGFFMLLLALHGFKSHAEKRGMMMQQQSGLVGPAIKLLCAAMLLSPAVWLNTLLLAFLGNASPESNPFNDIMSDEFASSLSWAVVQGVNVLGIGCFIKGVYTIAKAGSPNAQQGHVGKSICYFIGAICLVHVVTVTETVYTFLFGTSTIF